jgi:hypothetical protein
MFVCRFFRQRIFVLVFAPKNADDFEVSYFLLSVDQFSRFRFSRPWAHLMARHLRSANLTRTSILQLFKHCGQGRHLERQVMTRLFRATGNKENLVNLLVFRFVMRRKGLKPPGQFGTTENSSTIDSFLAKFLSQPQVGFCVNF